jgi:SSS family solute:Na+ symporter
LRPLDDRAERLFIRNLVVALSLVAFYFAVVSEVSLVALLLGAYGGVAQIFPLVFAAFYWPRATRAGAIAGLVSGLVVNTLFLVRPDLGPIPGLAANTTALVGVSLLTRPDARERVDAFVEA